MAAAAAAKKSSNGRTESFSFILRDQDRNAPTTAKKRPRPRLDDVISFVFDTAR